MATGSAALKAATKRKGENRQDQLARLTGEVESLRQQLRRAQRLATVGTMTAMVAHEFNNILTPIINYAQLARTNPALVDKAISRAAEGGQRATDICHAILGMTGNASAEPASVNLCELVADTLAAMARHPQRDGIELTVDVPEDLTLTARRVELQQVLLNLMINARSAVLAGNGPRSIRISSQENSRSVRIAVSDTGVGISPENMENIFQPFFTTKNSDSAESKGHGLGLAVCKEILTGMGGEISAQSILGEGTTFTITLAK